MASFWDNIGPGLLQTGLGVYSGKQADKAAEEKLRRAQGPLYDQLMGQAGKSLSMAGSMDPKALATERFGAQQALLEPGNEAARQKLMRELYSKGMLGAASYTPVPGTVATPGQPMNPQMAALLAAQEGARSKVAYESLGEGEQYLNNLLGRGTGLQSAANVARASGLQATPYKKTTGGMIASGLSGLLRDPSARGAVWEGAKKIPGMISDLGGWLGSFNAPAPSYDYSFDGFDWL